MLTTLVASSKGGCGKSTLVTQLASHWAQAGQQEAKDARRTLIWQVQSFNQLLARVQNDSALARHLLSLARNGGTEMSLQLAALRDDNIPVDPPTEWQPAGVKSEK